MIRVVIDPGVFISALIGRRDSAPDLIVSALIDDRVEAIVSPLLLDEIERVLRRPKFAARVDDATIREFLGRLRRHATPVDDPDDRPPATRDRDDDYLVALARAVGADALVSGDRDLLDADLTDLEVLTPRALADRLSSSA